MSSFFRNSVAIVAGNDSDVWFGGAWYRMRRKQNASEPFDRIRLLQLSAAGERFSGGEEPPESLSADSEIPCAMLLAHGAGG